MKTMIAAALLLAGTCASPSAAGEIKEVGVGLRVMIGGAVSKTTR